jgi:hypothetical protein
MNIATNGQAYPSQLIKHHMLMWCGLVCMVQPNTCTHTHNAFELCCCRVGVHRNQFFKHQNQVFKLRCLLPDRQTLQVIKKRACKC